MAEFYMHYVIFSVYFLLALFVAKLIRNLYVYRSLVKPKPKFRIGQKVRTLGREKERTIANYGYDRKKQHYAYILDDGTKTYEILLLIDNKK